MVLN
ncbi:hypothetical protein CJF31_00007637 [Rutstroemia sp. NJR-2017a BVV2]|jgi:hypothetical protein